jgi:3-hydroxyacyl-[acyl-carrier-protein] dehydratase
MSVLRKALQAAASPLEALPEANGWQRRYLFAANSAVFAGHFPGHPVLPAVTQILMAQMTLEDALGNPLNLCAVVQAKFTAPLGQDAVIELRVQEGRRAGLWDCALYSAGQPASRFSIETEAENV